MDYTQCSHHFIALSRRGSGERRCHEIDCDRRRCEEHGHLVRLNEIQDLSDNVFTFDKIHYATAPDICSDAFKAWHKARKEFHYARFALDTRFGIFVPEPIESPIFRQRQVIFEPVHPDELHSHLYGLLSHPFLERVTRNPARGKKRSSGANKVLCRLDERDDFDRAEAFIRLHHPYEASWPEDKRDELFLSVLSQKPWSEGESPSKRTKGITNTGRG